MALTLSKKAAAVKPSSTLEITALANEMKAKGIDVIGFGAGEPDYNTPDNINLAANAAVENGFTKYTTVSGIEELKRAVCKKFKEFNQLDYETNQIVVSNGGKHSLTNIFQSILNPGDEVIIPEPYWLSYPEIVKLADGIPVFVRAEKEQMYKVTASQIEKAITLQTKALIINSPCNPTGMVYSKDELQEIAEVVLHHELYIVSDEMYENLIYNKEKHVSIASLGKEIYNRTITCSGLSKSYAMTGWRIGYTGSSLEIAKLMGSIQSHQTSNPNSIAQKAAVEALLGPQDTVETMKQEFDRRRKYMYGRISKMPYISAINPEGAFYVFADASNLLGKIYQREPITTMNQFAKILLEDFAVAVVPCADFGFSDHFRLSYAISMSSIEKGMDRLEKFLNQVSEN